jgi:hypothetical protein
VIPGNLETRCAQYDTLDTGKQSLKDDNGRRSFPISPSSSPKQGNHIGRQTFPSVTFASTSEVCDPLPIIQFGSSTILSPVKNSTPITSLVIDLNANEDQVAAKINTPVTVRHELLGLDKGPLKSAEGVKLISAASAKSVKIMSKFWGDIADEDVVTDSTVEPDSDYDPAFESLKEINSAAKYLTNQSDGDSVIKNTKKTKKNKPARQAAGDYTSIISTRSKKNKDIPT